MLHEFLAERRSELIERCRVKGTTRTGSRAPQVERASGVPRFIDQLIETLQGQSTQRTAGTTFLLGARTSVSAEMGVAAARHGRELSLLGYTVDQVIHDYGDLCQAITDAAFELGAPIEVEEFRTLDRCLDDAIADSVSEWNYQSDRADADKATERVDRFVYQLRRLVHTATLAVVAIKAGNVGIAGATGAVLDRSLIDLRNVLDNAVGDLRGFRPEASSRHTRLSVAEILAESKISAGLEAQARGCTFIARDVDPALAVDADQLLLLSALGQLLNNAFKFSRPNGKVVFSAIAAGDRIRIEVEDSCGGLIEGQAEAMLRLRAPGGSEEAAGGLSMCQHSVQASGGTLSVRSLPGSGCLFAIDLPRQLLPKAASGQTVG